jgi:hypothetical protein
VLAQLKHACRFYDLEGVCVSRFKDRLPEQDKTQDLYSYLFLAMKESMLKLHSP